MFRGECENCTLNPCRNCPEGAYDCAGCGCGNLNGRYPCGQYNCWQDIYARMEDEEE